MLDFSSTAEAPKVVGIDPVTFEVIRNSLLNITEEMALTVRRGAGSALPSRGASGAPARDGRARGRLHDSRMHDNGGGDAIDERFAGTAAEWTKSTLYTGVRRSHRRGGTACLPFGS